MTGPLASGYGYCVEHDIIGSPDGAQTDYQVMLTLHSGAGTNSGGDIYLQDHSLSFPLDVRFHGRDGTALPYEIESSTATTAAVWVKIPAIAAGVNSVYPMVISYGKADDTGDSDGPATFPLLYDAFAGAAIDETIWGTRTGSIAVSGGAVTLTGAATAGAITSAASFAATTAIRASGAMSYNHGVLTQLGYSGGTSSITYLGGYYYANKYNTYLQNAGHAEVAADIGTTHTGTHIWEILRKGSAKPAFLIDGSAVTVGTDANGYYSGTLPVLIGARTDATRTVALDWIKVRTYTPNEPTHGAYGPEQTAADAMVWTGATPTTLPADNDGGCADVFGSTVVFAGGAETDNTNFSNAIYSSTDPDLITWTAHGNAPWTARRYAGHVVFKGRWYIIGGTDSSGNALNDVWSSATPTDPESWTQDTAAAFSTGGRHAVGITTDGTYIYVIGGYLTAGVSAEVFRSADGATWTRVATAAFGNRQGQAAVYFDGKLWAFNGKDDYNALYSTVYSSSDQGATWTLEATGAWGGRYVSPVVVIDGEIWIVGGGYWTSGADVRAYNDVWSSPDGVTWTQHNLHAEFPPVYQGCAVVWNGRISLFTGYVPGSTPPALDQVWTSPFIEGMIVAELGRSLTPEIFANVLAAEIGRSLTPEAATALEGAITAEMARGLTPEATAALTITIVAELGRSLTPEIFANVLAAEIGRSLTPEAATALEGAITAEMARGLTPEAHPDALILELGRSLTLEAGAALATTVTAELDRALALTPPRATYWYNFDGVKWISSTVRRSITDHFHQLDEEISGAEELPIDFLRQAKVITQDLHGTSRCIFYGMLPGINQKISWRNDSTTIKGYDHGWRLSDQKVPAARRVISPTVDPRDVVLEFLGGDRWETKTEVRPYRIAPLTAYGTEAMPAHQWEFSAETSCLEAIREFDEKCDRIFLVKWMQIGNAISVDNPDPSRRLMRVEAEDFDAGGEGVGYHDVDTRNLGGAYRSGEGVDIENTPGEGGRNVGWIRDGEWLDFTREFAWAGSYAFSARVAAAAKATPAYFKVYLDGVYQFRINVGAAPTSDAGYRTGSYQVFTNTVPDRLTSTSGVVLADAPQYLEIPTTGDHVIRLEFWGNTENITPSVMHQNIARFDLSPQGGSEIDPNDVRYQSIAYWVDEAKIDSPTEGLDLPPPLTISDPGRWPKDGTIQITKQARQRYNRVIVRGHSASGVWFEATAQTAAVAAGEPPSEYLETNDRVTPATIQGYANALLAYYQLDQRSYSCTLMQRMDLEIYQKIRFTDHPQLPSAWCRITSTEKRVDGKADSCTITFVPEQTLAAQRRLQRMLRPTNTSAITDVVRSEIARQSEVWVGTCAEIIDDDTATFTLEQGGTSQGRITPDG